MLHSKQVFDSLMNAARLIEDHDQYQELVTTLISDHLSRGVQKNHIHAIRAALLHTFHLIGPHCGLNNDHLFAWKSFINQLMIQLADGLLPDDEEGTKICACTCVCVFELLLYIMYNTL